MARSRDVITLTHVGSRFVLGFTGMANQLWRVGGLRDRRVANFPTTDEGYRDAVGAFESAEPTGQWLAPPGRAWSPARLTPLGMGVLVVAVVVLLAGATVGAVATGSDSGQHANTASVMYQAGLPVPSGASIAPSNGANAAVPNGQRGWVASDPSTAIFLQWTRTGDTVSGSLTFSYLTRNDAQQVSTENQAFSGVLNGDSVTLSLPQGLGSSTNLAVQIRGAQLVVSWPQQDGTLLPLALNPGAATAYNQAVADLQNTADARAATARSQAAQASASAVQSAEHAAADAAVDHATSTLSDDLGSLTDAATGVTSAIQSTTSSTLNQMQADLATTQKAAAAVESEAKQAGPGDATVCSDAAGVVSDAAGVDSDQAGVQSDTTGLNGDLQALQDALATVNPDQQALQQAQQADPGYQPQPARPSQHVISAAISAAQSALRSGASTKANALATAASLDKQANQAATEASKTGGC